MIIPVLDSASVFKYFSHYGIEDNVKKLRGSYVTLTNFSLDDKSLGKLISDWYLTG